MSCSCSGIDKADKTDKANRKVSSSLTGKSAAIPTVALDESFTAAFRTLSLCHGPGAPHLIFCEGVLLFVEELVELGLKFLRHLRHRALDYSLERLLKPGVLGRHLQIGQRGGTERKRERETQDTREKSETRRATQTRRFGYTYIQIEHHPRRRKNCKRQLRLRRIIDMTPLDTCRDRSFKTAPAAARKGTGHGRNGARKKGRYGVALICSNRKKEKSTDRSLQQRAYKTRHLPR